MPTYLFKCPNCLGKIPRSRPRKYGFILDECNAGPKGRVKVRMKYVRTITNKRAKP